MCSVTWCSIVAETSHAKENKLMLKNHPRSDHHLNLKLLKKRNLLKKKRKNKHLSKNMIILKGRLRTLRCHHYSRNPQLNQLPKLQLNQLLHKLQLNQIKATTTQLLKSHPTSFLSQTPHKSKIKISASLHPKLIADGPFL